MAHRGHVAKTRQREFRRNPQRVASDKSRMTLTVLQFSETCYSATLRAADGAVLARLNGPPGWVLEQLASAFSAASPPSCAACGP